jgi:hypothetical protein
MLSEVQHHDAMFSAPGTVLPAYSSIAAVAAPAVSDNSSAQQQQQQQQQQHGRAVRQQRSASPDTAATAATAEPLYKVVKMGDTVEARYTADDVWYEAKVSCCCVSQHIIANAVAQQCYYNQSHTGASAP